MPDPTPLAKAQLIQLDDNGRELAAGMATVQFNPESLKVTFANQIATPQGAGDQSGPAARQFVGAGTTKLAVTLIFDVTGQQSGTQQTDVRQLTKQVAFFITPKANGTNQTQLIPPQVRFAWGSLQFDGIMDAMEESLEFFSSEGIPLRATVTFGLTQQKILPYVFRQPPAQPAGQPGAPTGTQPLDQAPAGGTVAGMAADRGLADNWKNIATANGIENPRQLTPGQLIDFSLTQPGS